MLVNSARQATRMNAMNTLARTVLGTVAAGAMAVSSATPALARDNGGGINAGEVIAGALIIGGIAAVAAAASKNDRNSGYGYYQRRGYSYGYGNPRQAVTQCVRAAEASAGRYSHGRASVTDIRSVNDRKNGYDIKGRIAVNTSGRQWRQGDRRYGQGWNGDYRGWNSNLRGYDSGQFTCKIRHGRITDLKFSGIRGLR